MELQIELIEGASVSERIVRINTERKEMLEALHLMEQNNIISKEDSNKILEKILETSRKQLKFLLAIDGNFMSEEQLKGMHRAMDSTWAPVQGRHGPRDAFTG